MIILGISELSKEPKLSKEYPAKILIRLGTSGSFLRCDSRVSIDMKKKDEALIYSSLLCRVHLCNKYL